MGLDMYLTKKTFIWSNKRQKLIIKGLGKKEDKAINPIRVEEITEEIGYWRKSNSIHAWFVKNIQGGDDNCEKYNVPQEKIEELLKIVKQILDKPSKELAKQLLPTQNGFFFGDIEYDLYYFKDLEETKIILENALKELKRKSNLSVSIYYQSSW